MVPPAFEATVYFPRTGGLMSSTDMSRQAYIHGNEVLYRTVPTYKCEQTEGLSYYDFEFIKFKVLKTKDAYRIVVDKDESNQDIEIYVEGVGLFEGRNLAGNFKQFPIHHKPTTTKPTSPAPAPTKPTSPVSAPPVSAPVPPSPKKKRRRAYRTSHKRPIKRGKERVAISVLTLKRPAWLKQCLESILQNKTPLKIILTNQADYSKAQMKIINQWKNRPYVHYRVNDPPKWPGASRAQVFRMAKKAGYKYIITLDDDCVLLPKAIDKLVKAADKYPKFYAMSGYLITPHRGTYMLGGEINSKGVKHAYLNFDLKSGVREADFISNGFRLVRLEPLVVPDSTYTIGLTDFDWAMKAKSKGLRLAVCGEAGAYHKFMFINGKPTKFSMPSEYHAIRRNRVEIRKMKQKFESKWGIKI